MQRLYASGRIHFLQVYFHAATFTGPIYVGLGTGAIPDPLTAAMSDINEVAGTGYARKPVLRVNDPSTGWTIDTGNFLVSTPVLTFTNSGVDPSVRWTDADYAFLTLSPSGTTAPNILLGTAEMETISIPGTGSEQIVFTFALYS